MSSKVLYIGGFELPDKNAAAFRVQANAGLLAQTGCTVYFRGISKNKTVQKKFVKRDEFYHSEIKYPASIKEWIRYTFSADDVIKIIEDLNADTVICYNYPSFAMKRIIKYCHKRRINVINECTEWYSSRGMGIFRGCIKKIDTLMRIYIIPRLVDYNIVTTQYLADKIKRHSCVIPEIYTVQMPYKANETNNNEIKLIYMGTPGLKFNKDNLGMMIEILSCVDADFNFDIVGINEQDYIDNLCINENNYNKIKKTNQILGKS